MTLVVWKAIHCKATEQRKTIFVNAQVVQKDHHTFLNIHTTEKYILTNASMAVTFALQHIWKLLICVGIRKEDT